MLGEVNQMPADLLVEGEDDEQIKMSKLGQLWTAGFRERLTAAGKVYSVTVGTLTTGADFAGILGGGGGTCLDSDQPEIIIAVDAGYYLIPLEIKITGIGDLSTTLDEARIIAFGDRTAATAAGATGTTETPVNLLDGGPAFPGRAFSAVTVDLTDPVMDELFDVVIVKGQGTLVAPVTVKMDYEPASPSILAGPCNIVVCWGGTSQLYCVGKVVFACVPSTWFPVS